MRFEYLVVPYIGVAKRSWFTEQGPQHIATDLQNTLNAHAAQGWEYVRVERIEIRQQVGCLVGLILRKEAGVYMFHEIVFRRPVAVS